MSNSTSCYIKRFIILAFLIISVFGCAAYVEEDQEGGISGTGNQIDCQDERHKDDPRCRKP